MPMPLLHNRTTGKTLPSPASLLTSLWGRCFGLLAPGVSPGAIVGLRPCHWIHTFGLRAPIDAAYCDRAGRVLHLTLALGQCRFDRPVPGAYTTWEAPTGTFNGRISVGDTLEVVSDAHNETARPESLR